MADLSHEVEQVVKRVDAELARPVLVPADDDGVPRTAARVVASLTRADLLTLLAATSDPDHPDVVVSTRERAAVVRADSLDSDGQPTVFVGGSFREDAVGIYADEIIRAARNGVELGVTIMVRQVDFVDVLTRHPWQPYTGYVPTLCTDCGDDPYRGHHFTGDHK